jgi:hypothetical protein
VIDFVRAYENIYTFCLDYIPLDADPDFRCRWLVDMTDKETKSIRVGYGIYDWQFGDSKLVRNLRITIKAMLILPSNHHQQVVNWLSHLPYPWCRGSVAAAGMPSISELREVHHFLTHIS